ncbi:restriction endonuclease subunit S [Acetobacterium fimetarium]|uniref:Restriction endonuclease subunit S n=1 Tax=Acetobacterium fimetarium TaxID=52691 RepID=A0ABR6WXM3_9FIRM|nr:restriction endonuclease subunit S [Acetobacterium fimetarium]MBC3805399.1 restriction endonuclease subunit S [Acetobacterium fimetarium]
MMNEKKKMVPGLRFPGFSGEWEERKLGEVYTQRNERGFDSLQILSVSIHNGVSNEELDSDTLGKKVRRSEDKALYKHVYVGDLVLNMMRAWQGAIGVVQTEGMVSPAYITAIPSTQLYPPFMDYCLRRDETVGQIDNLSYGVTDFRKRLYWDSFIDVLCCIPSVHEQERITAFFKQLDHLITLHQRQITHLQTRKKGLLQKMFPKDGELFPELRFPGFTDAWEMRKLGEVVQITMGQSPNSENYTHNPDDHILVQGNADMRNGQVFPRVWTTQVTKKAEKGDLILSVRAPVGDIGKTDYDVVLGRGVAALKGNEFIYQSLGKMKQNGYWNKLSTGSTFEAINSNDIRDALFMMPKIEEQFQIGAFFKQLDDSITLHQRKLDHLQDRKKALLQQMFV